MGRRELTPGRLLPRSFFARPPAVVAAELVGAHVICRSVRLRLTEVEAYSDTDDAASHAFRRTPRSEVMFLEPGRLYVYFSYGMHWCANIVAHLPRRAGAVLLRAGEVLDGIEVARSRRPAIKSVRDVASGPGRLTKALGIDGSFNGGHVCAPGRLLQVRAGAPVMAVASPRVGISKATELRWRFTDPKHP